MKMRKPMVMVSKILCLDCSYNPPCGRKPCKECKAYYPREELEKDVAKSRKEKR